MLAPLRRCPASLPRALRTAAATRSALRNASTALPRTVLSSSRIVPLLSTRAFQLSARPAEAQVAATQSSKSSRSHSPITNFQELEDRNIVHPNVIKAIVKDMGITTMTEVQSATLHQALQGTDLIAQAKTGTGKTLGFLLPMLQNIIAKDPSLATPRMAGRMGRWPRVRPDIRAIIISPTRELAEQIAVEARKLTRHTSIAVQTAVGGTGKRDGMRRIMTEGCNILVATPGRLNDILGDEFAPIPAENLDYLIFDEADRLLEAGFWEEITSIQEKLPNREVRDRQTLMFSATVPKEVVRLVRQALKPGFHFVKTVREDEEPTHQRVPQKAVICSGLETQLPALLELCQREATLAKAGEKRPFKAIVYFNTLKEVELGYSSFKEIRRNQRRQHDVWESDLLFIHSGLTQSGRQRMADTFRASESAILFSTDVTARGMDFPNVTHVIQLGISRDPADYIHRIGRTGRAGKEGEGWLLLPQFNRQAIQQKLGHLPIKIDSSLETAKADIHNLSSLPEHSAKIITDVQDGFKELDRQDLIESFNGILGAYQGTRDKQSVLDSMNTMATQLWGLDRAPKVYGRLGESFSQGRGSGRGRSDAPFDRRSRNSQNSRSGFQNNRSGFQNDRSGFQSGRSGYQNDRSGFQSGRSDFQNDRSGSQNDRSGSQNDRSGRRPFAGRPQGGFNTGKEFSRGGGYEKRRQRETGW